MSAQTAEIVLYVITAVAAAVWLAGSALLNATVRGIPAGQPEPFDAGEVPTAGRLVGAVEVDGRPETLAARASSILARGSVPSLGAVRIVERTQRAIQFQGVREFGRVGAVQFIQEARIELRDSSEGRTQIVYAVDLRRSGGLLLAAAIVQALGLVAIVLGFWLIRTYVVPGAHPALRAQAVQMVQVIHFLWPPFLLLGLYRRGRAAVRSTLEAFLTNLPYLDQPE
jgi:hypothetical protein